MVLPSYILEYIFEKMLYLILTTAVIYLLDIPWTEKNNILISISGNRIVEQRHFFLISVTTLPIKAVLEKM